jgi:hypothetical protein
MQTSLLPRVSLGVLTRSLGRFQPDGFVIALIGTVAMAALLPCQGMGARIFHAFGSLAIASLFFLQGARLSRDAVVASDALATTCGDNVHHFCAVSFARIRPVGGSPGCAPSVAVVRRAVCLRSTSTVQSSIA